MQLGSLVHALAVDACSCVGGLMMRELCHHTMMAVFAAGYMIVCCVQEILLHSVHQWPHSPNGVSTVTGWSCGLGLASATHGAQGAAQASNSSIYNGLLFLIAAWMWEGAQNMQLQLQLHALPLSLPLGMQQITLLQMLDHDCSTR